jgi:hypothetical protein
MIEIGLTERVHGNCLGLGDLIGGTRIMDGEPHMPALDRVTADDLAAK